MKKNEKLKSKELNKAIIALRRGVVVFPTDTVYGIGCVYNNVIAIARIRKIKGSNQNFPILVSNMEQLHKLVKVNAVAQNLISRFWPGGLTLILKSKITGEKIGVRMPNSQIVQDLIAGVGVPIIGTSANLHGDATPKSYKELNSKIVSMADFVLKGKCDGKMESTVIDATINPLKVLRPGPVKI